MKKLLTFTTTVFLTILTAGIALASTSTPASTSPFPATFNSGALYFINSAGAVATDNGAGNTTPGVATVTVNQAQTTSPQPALFYGTLATDLGVTTTSTTTTTTASTPTTTNTFTFTAILGDDGNYHITGTDTNGDLLQAVCRIRNNRNAYQQKSSQEGPSLSIRGSVITAPGSSSATTYSFAGRLSQ